MRDAIKSCLSPAFRPVRGGVTGSAPVHRKVRPALTMKRKWSSQTVQGVGGMHALLKFFIILLI